MTSADRRLDKVEASLSPTALVLRWLAEAHTYDDVTTYTRSLVEEDPPTFPLDRLAHEAETSARQQTRGLPREEPKRRSARRSSRPSSGSSSYILAQEFLDREVLIQAALSAYLALAI